MRAIIMTIIAAVVASSIVAAAFFAGLFPTNSGTPMPKMSLSGATVETDSSIGVGFGVGFAVVEEPRGISNYSVIVGVNDSSAAPAQFDDGGKATVRDLDGATNSTGPAWQKIEFHVQSLDEDGDGRVSEGDRLRVTCSEPLRADTRHVVTVIDGSGPFSSASCRT